MIIRVFLNPRPKIVFANTPVITIVKKDDEAGVIYLVPIKPPVQTLEDQSDYIKNMVMLQNAIKAEKAHLPIGQRVRN